MPEMTAQLQASERIRAVQTPIIPVVGELIRSNPGAVSLGQGVVHYPPPPEALARLGASAGLPEAHGYGHVSGLPGLLEQLARKLADENGIDVEKGLAVVVTAGGNMAFMNAVLAIADHGDEVIVPTPYYFNHEMALRIAGCRPVLVPTDANYQLRIGAIEEAVTNRTRAVVTVSPNNPTGAVYDAASLTAVNRLCIDRGIYHISDEAYEVFTYDGVTHHSPGSIEGAERHTISLFSFSKSYGMPGLRMGYMVVPDRLLPSVKKIQDTHLICPPMPAQFAAMGALEAGRAYCSPYVAELSEVRSLVRRRLAGLGDRIELPGMQGAFYGLARLETGLGDMEIVRRLIEDFGVAVIPGRAFGVDDRCMLRIAYGALEKDSVATAMDRLVEGLAQMLG
jgi:aspartate/methionine/tyrosine aminotransferase